MPGGFLGFCPPVVIRESHGHCCSTFTLHCLPLIYSSSFSLFPLHITLCSACAKGPGTQKPTGGNKDGSKAAGPCVVKSVAKSIAYPGATWTGSENSSLILKKSHWRLRHLALRKLPKLTHCHFGLKFDGICFDNEKRLELQCNGLLIRFEDLFDH